MANINRDYLVIADLKNGKITSPTMSFYNTDKNIANLFVKLQITMSTNPNITGFVSKEEANDYNVKLTVIKPKTTMLVELEGVIQDNSVVGNGAVYLFDMPKNFTDQVGSYICELEITCMVNGREEIVTCDPFKYVVKGSAVTGLNVEIEPSPDIPVLKQLIDEVRYLQENGGSIVNLSKYQKMEDDKLNTTNKTIVGGINELNTQCADIKQNKANKSEVDESFSQINQSNIERDKKISSIENINTVQNAKLDTLFNSASGEMELESNSNNIKLDSSKKGTATVNYIKGNTLVNCAKENRELILNDEINVEGTNCTINDTVEGGLVDIELEGLSLNNLWKDRYVIMTSSESIYESGVVKMTANGKVYMTVGQRGKSGLYKPNTDYTCIFYVLKNTIDSSQTIHLNVPYANTDGKVDHLSDSTIGLPGGQTGCVVKKLRTISSFEDILGEGFFPRTQIAPTITTGDFWYKCVILEGDYTNKPIPTEAFTGIKSVGEEVTLTNLGGTIIPTKSDGAGVISNINDVYKLVKGNAVSYLKFNLSKISNFIGKTVTIKVDKLKTSSTHVQTRIYNRTNPSNSTPLVNLTEDKQYFIVNIPSNVQSTDTLELLLYVDGVQDIDWIEVSNKITIVEGGYENSNLEYFEGSIKKYKIETKSQNKNLFDIEEAKINLTGTPVEYVTYQDKNCMSATSHFSSKWIDSFKFKPNTQYKLTYNVYYENALNERKRGIYLRFVYTDGTTSSVNMPDTNAWKTITLISDEGKTVKCIDNSWGYEVRETKTYIDLDTISLVEGIESVPYVKHQHHKKAILLDEPHRGIEGGAKDRIVKREGKLYVKRNCDELVLNGSENWYTPSNNDTHIQFNLTVPTLYKNLISDRFVIDGSITQSESTKEGICVAQNNILVIRILKSKLETQDVQGFKKWLQTNPTTLIYSLKTPIYEEIKGLNNEFSTYEEVTHVSTNTAIPCNQKIQNTGIECMLKPSTLYSIHDIKTGSGTAKYNLGGTVNTSNKITTGTTLTDNYLRLYGKGLTSKDVEVFEGDILQTPYFTGMLSAFEDKKITQEMVDSGLEKAENLGKYRVGIKVVGKNKLNIDEHKISAYIGGEGGNIFTRGDLMQSYIIECEPNTTYYGKHEGGNRDTLATFSNYPRTGDVANQLAKNGSSITTTHQDKYLIYYCSSDVNSYPVNNPIITLENTTEYEPYKEYKTSILLDEPLYKDNELCVYEGQLGYWKNSEKVVFDGSEDWNLESYEYVIKGLGHKPSGMCICDKIPILETSYNKAPQNTFAIKVGNLYSLVVRNDICINVEGFKQWLQANPTTVVYELAEPYFEPLTPQLPRWVLDIFDNSTVSIDTIIPTESKFTYTSYIPSISAIQETNKNQDELINVSLCATDEMYMMLEPLLQSVPQTLQINERMVSKMVDLYVAMVMRELKTINEVPLRYREEVKKILEQLEK